MSRYEEAFFTLTVDEAAQSDNYDIIIIGSGIGGGVLANDLYDTNLKVGNAKRVLLLERGGLVFHSHSLNTARPTGDRGRQNDAMFAKFRDQYVFSPPQPEWDGGPMYCLGGRSAAWGLFAPRIHDSILNDRFHDKVHRHLSNTYYDKAERLMLLSLPTTRRIHQRIMDRLNISGLAAEKESQVQWKWGRIASEFADPTNFDFAEGAYSSIDKILEISMSQRIQENDYFKTVLNADVRKFKFREDKSVEEIIIRKPDGTTTSIKVKSGTKVILCAGSVNSPAILMRSGDEWQQKLYANGGLRLTDHDVYFYENKFRYSDPKHRDEYGAMKLQTYVDLGASNPDPNAGEAPGMALANISIDASSFLGRRNSPDDNLPKFFMVFLLQSRLKQSNTMVLEGDEPKITLYRGDHATQGQYDRMKNLTKAAMESLTQSAKLQFVNSTTDFDLKQIRLGSIAHELGTLPMKGKDPNSPYCLDEDLCMRPELAKDLYVCDLSCFPHSPEANPTLTLAALAIRLSRHLLPRGDRRSVDTNTLRVVNHSEGRIKAWLTDHADRHGEAQAQAILDPGKEHTYTNVGSNSRCLLVHRIDPATNDWTRDPVPMIIFPERANAILRDRVIVINVNEQSF